VRNYPDLVRPQGQRVATKDQTKKSQLHNNSGSGKTSDTSGARGGIAGEQQSSPTSESPRETDHHAKEDLEAQLRMAQAAEAQVILSVVGSILLGFTLWFTRIAANAANEAAAQTARSVETQIRIEQPLLFITHIFDPSHGRAAFDVRNLGKTPAVLVATFAAFEARDTLPDLPNYGRPRRILGKILQPDDSEQFTTPVDKDEYLAIYDYQQTAFFWGYLQYEDVFGRTRVAGFGFSGDPMMDDDGNIVPGLLWSRVGGKAYNYDREEPDKG
jgi:hypothetical protein